MTVYFDVAKQYGPYMKEISSWSKEGNITGEPEELNINGETTSEPEISDLLEEQLRKLLSGSKEKDDASNVSGSEQYIEAESKEAPILSDEKEDSGYYTEKIDIDSIDYDYINEPEKDKQIRKQNEIKRAEVKKNVNIKKHKGIFGRLLDNVIRYDSDWPQDDRDILDEIRASHPEDEYLYIFPVIHRIKNKTREPSAAESTYTFRGAEPSPAGFRDSVKEFFTDRSTGKVNKKYIGILIGLCVLLLATVYTMLSFPYYQRFLKGTYINGTNVSGLEVSEVEEIIRGKVEDYSLDMIFRGGEEKIVPGEDIGYHYVPTGSVTQILKDQISFTWITREFGKEEHVEATTSTDYDKKLLSGVLGTMDQFDETKEIAPVDAYVGWEDNKFAVIPEVEGDFIDREAFDKTVDTVLKSQVDKLDLEEEGLYLAPAVRQDDEHLNAIVDSGNQYMPAGVVYNVPGGTVSAGPEVVKEWLVQDPETELYSIDDETLWARCNEFVTNMAKTYNTDRKLLFHSTTRGDVHVDSIAYGWKIDVEAETEALYDDIKNHVVTEREPRWSEQGVTLANGGIGNTYIEVDILSQHVYCYIDGEMVYDCNCVSGLANSSRRTPTGVFTIYMKDADRTLMGPEINGSPSYASYVNFWMPFYGNYGLHDAGWRDEFGGDIYTYYGSHGCVNLPYKGAAFMFENFSRGTPVIVFEGDDPLPEETEESVSSSESESYDDYDEDEDYYEDDDDEEYYDDDDEDY